jgi:hypothetical protein
MTTESIELSGTHLDLVKTLARELDNAGHDDLSYLDLLDCLASAGLMLVPDVKGIVGAEYLAAVAVRGNMTRAMRSSDD